MQIGLSKYNWTPWVDKIALFLVAFILIMNFLIPERWSISRLENLLLPLIGVIIVSINKFKVNKTIIYTLIALFIATVLSNIANSKGLNAYMISLRFLKYIFIFLLVSHSAIRQRKSIDTIFDFFAIALIIINCIQIINPFGWGIDLLQLYSNHEQNYELNEHLNRNFRLFGTQNNPNNNAVLWSMLCIYYFARTLSRKSILNYTIICFGILFIFLTQSRTCLLGIVIAGGTYLLVQNFSIKRVSLLLIGGLFVIALIQLSGLSYMQQIIHNNPLKISSLNQRYDVWESLFELWKTEPILGLGLNTDFISLVGKSPDSEYFYFLAGNGLIFIIPYLFLLLYIITTGIIKIKTSSSYVLYIMLPTLLIINAITNYSFNNIKIATLFFILIALTNRQSILSKNHEENTDSF